ncbi:MAG: SMP-30/gluconolactonase/LRE family protein [Rhizobiaceae bacterium]
MSAVDVFDDTVCELGEGPSYDPGVDTVFWLDIVGRKLIERPMGATECRLHELPVMASAIASIDTDRQLLATEKGLYVRRRASGALDLLQPIEADNDATRSNDARVHPGGAFWIGTMGKKAERHAGAIYWYRRGELRLLYPGLTVPNSICFSPDGAIAYFTDSAKGILFRVACDPEDGRPVAEPSIFVDHRHQPGGLDGSIVDADGQLWNARWGAAALDVYTPQGKRIETIDMPVRQPSCPAFVGAGASRIVVTSAWENMSAQDRVGDPLAGKTFILARTVRGRFEPAVLI